MRRFTWVVLAMIVGACAADDPALPATGAGGADLTGVSFEVHESPG